MNVGQRIREAREELGMQRTVLARRLGVAPNTIWRYEFGEREPSMAMLEMIARELRTEPAELMREPSLAGKAEASETGRGAIEDVEREVEILGFLEGAISERAEEVRAGLNRRLAWPHKRLGAFCVLTVASYNGLQQWIEDEWGDPSDRRTPAPVREALGRVDDAMNFDLGDAVAEVMRVYEALPAETQITDLEVHRTKRSA